MPVMNSLFFNSRIKIRPVSPVNDLKKSLEVQTTFDLVKFGVKALHTA